MFWLLVVGVAIVVFLAGVTFAGAYVKFYADKLDRAQRAYDSYPPEPQKSNYQLSAEAAQDRIAKINEKYGDIDGMVLASRARQVVREERNAASLRFSLQ